jgi:small subunit ribosomal protein S20
MANHKSCLKRIRQTKKRNYYNKTNKKLVKQAIRNVEEASTYDSAQELLSKAQSILDRVAARGIMHKNTVARRKARLSSLVKNLKAA